jgi:septal ring factor EnvC (AmiA/AmiB activator)
MDRGIVTGFNTSAIGQYSSAMGANVTATGEGELYNSGNVKGLSFISTSDRRVKKNIQSFTGALDKVLQLQARTYTYNVEEYPRFKAEKDKPQIGFIAQEIEEVLPQLVTTDGDDEALKSVRYGQLTPVLVEAIKEQQQQITNLKNQLQAQQQQITKQQQQIDELLKLLKH